MPIEQIFSNGNLNVYGKLKEKIIKALLTNEQIVKIIKNSPNISLPAKELRYKQVIPWKHVPDTQETAQTIITFEVRTLHDVNGAVKEMILDIYVMAHESLMPFDDKVGKSLGIEERGTRIDILSEKIDYIINGSTELGFGQVKIIGDEPFRPTDNYQGRYLRYAISGWNRYGEQM